MPDAQGDFASIPIPELINRLSFEYDERTLAKHEMGEEKYGPGTWLGIDTIEHALDEIVDLGNYARFTYIKLRLLQLQVAKIVEGSGATAAPQAGKEMLGKNGIITGKGIPE